MEFKDHRNKTNINLILVLFFLSLISLANLYSASHSLNSIETNKIFISQIIWYLGGWLVFFALTFTNPKIFKTLAWPIYFVNLILLALVQFMGKSFYGAQRWLDFGFFRYQPSETMKVALVLVLALTLQKSLSKRCLNLKDLIIPIVACLVPFVMTVIQPDLGTSLIMFIIGGCLALFVGIDKKILILVALAGSLSLPLVWNYGMKDYQKARVQNFLNPGKDLRGGGYNSRQSKIAVGSGMLTGRGFRKGTQSQLEFLPERHTDFIFSVLSEEEGFIGSFVTICIFFTLFFILMSIAQNATDPFYTLTTFGVGTIIFWHFFINIGMITGILPVVGMPLPFLSYGGSSILTTMGALGIVSAISRTRSLF